MIPRSRPELSTTTALPPLLLSAIFILILCIGADGQTRVTYVCVTTVESRGIARHILYVHAVLARKRVNTKGPRSPQKLGINYQIDWAQSCCSCKNYNAGRELVLAHFSSSKRVKER